MLGHAAEAAPVLGVRAMAEGPFLPAPLEHSSLWGGCCPVPLVGVGPLVLLTWHTCLSQGACLRPAPAWTSGV